jgi:hypothetical protein
LREAKMNLKEETIKMKNWAVVGATNKRRKFGYKIYQRLKENGYNVYPVNPNLDNINGDKCYDNLDEIDDRIDVVDLVVNPEIGIKIMEDIKKNNIKYVWLQPGARSAEIRRFTRDNDIDYINGCIYVELL